MLRRCDCCKFSVPGVEDYFCYRYPPIVTSKAGESPSSQYPPIRGEWHCGEFRRSWSFTGMIRWIFWRRRRG